MTSAVYHGCKALNQTNKQTNGYEIEIIKPIHHIATLYFSAVSEWLKVPDTQFMLDHVRPDFLMLRVGELIGHQSNVQCENLINTTIWNFVET